MDSFSDAHIQLSNLSKNFGSQTVLKNISLKVKRGKITTIIGKSGVGKSILLKHIAGLIQPDSGSIIIDGENISVLKPRKQRQKLAKLDYVFQNNALLDALTVAENVVLPLEETTQLKPNSIKKKVSEILEQLELDSSVWTKYPAQISGGMQRRVALARALVREPEIVLFDEPTTGLDPPRRNAVFAMITRYQRQFGFTALLVSHDIPDVFAISDWLVVLSEKGIRFTGRPEQLSNSQDNDVIELISTNASWDNTAAAKTSD